MVYHSNFGANIYLPFIMFYTSQVLPELKKKISQQWKRRFHLLCPGQGYLHRPHWGLAFLTSDQPLNVLAFSGNFSAPKAPKIVLKKVQPSLSDSHDRPQSTPHLESVVSGKPAGLSFIHVVGELRRFSNQEELPQASSRKNERLILGGQWQQWLTGEDCETMKSGREKDRQMGWRWPAKSSVIVPLWSLSWEGTPNC